MHESLTARAVRKATDEATKRGHKLGAWGFMNGQAANRCERDGCDCRVLVTPGDAREAVGAAVALGCKEGGNAWLEEPAPQPSGPTMAEAPAMVAAFPDGRLIANPDALAEPVKVAFGRKRVAA